MTEEQERQLVHTVERLTVAVQVIASRCWESLGTAESTRLVGEVGALNMQLCDAFPHLRDSPGDGAT